MNDRIDRAERERIRATFGGQRGWGQWGSANEHARYAQDAPNRRRRCRCGCGGAATHVGKANGVALMSGCELSVRRWTRVDPAPPLGNEDEEER